MSAPGTAAYYRTKRLAHGLAMELGVTPAQAEEELARREARLRWLAAEQRRQSKQSAHAEEQPPAASRSTAEPWMMRE